MRLSPSFTPPTTPQLALTPTNNKSIANQSPHQRSGLTLDEAAFMAEEYDKIQRSISSKSYSNINDILNELKGLLTRAQLYIHCLKQEGFFKQSPEQQAQIINAFCNKKNIDRNTIAQDQIKVLEKITDDVRIGYLSQAQFIDDKGNLLDNHTFWGELVEACETSVRNVEEEIKNLPPSST